MSLKNSIFSSDTLTALPRPGKAFWLTLGLCAAVRILIALGSDSLDHIPAPSMHTRYEYLERVEIREKTPKPTILIMGNSLARYGLLEKRIAETCQLPSAEVLNLAVESGRPFEAMLFLKRNPQIAERVRLVIYNVGRHQIERGTALKYTDRLYRYGSLSDKLAADGWGNRARLLSDVIWPWYSQRRELSRWLAGAAGMDSFQFEEMSLRPAWRPEFSQLWQSRQPRFAQLPSPEVFEGDHTLSALHTGILHEFIDYWKDRDVHLVLLQTPTRKVWNDAVDANSAFCKHQQLFNQLIESEASATNVTYIQYRDAQQCGIDDPADFLDYSHLTKAGARKLTDTLLADMHRLGWLPVAESSQSHLADATAR